MRTFQLVEVNAPTPYERGLQYGSQAAQKIRAGVESYRELFTGTYGWSWRKTQDLAMSYVPYLEETMPEILAEAEGIAAGAGLTLDELMVLNTRYELTKYPKEEECTTLALLPEATEGGKTYIVKNWDYRAGILDNIVIIHLTQEDGTRILGLTEAGQLIREGFNSNGIGLVNNSLQSIYDREGLGVPVTFLRRRVLASKSFEEARDILVNSRRNVSNNMLLVSAQGQAVDVEANPTGSDRIEAKGGILAHANHFVARPEIDALVGRPKNRDARLDELIRARAGHVTVAYLMECLKDHKYHPLSICGHWVDPDEPMDKRRMTVASMICDFQAGEAYICAGPPCEGEYRTYKL